MFMEGVQIEIFKGMGTVKLPEEDRRCILCVNDNQNVMWRIKDVFYIHKNRNILIMLVAYCKGSANTRLLATCLIMVCL